MDSFNDILIKARGDILSEMPIRLQLKFYRLYILALQRQLEKVRPTDIATEAEAKEFMRGVFHELRRYTKAAEVTAKKDILEVMQRGVRAHKDALAAAVAEAGVNVSMSFVGVSQEAFENLFARRSLGLTASYKSLSTEQISVAGRTIEDALEGMVLDGDSWQRATQRIIDGLTQGDEGLSRMAKAMARKSRGLGNWLESATSEAEIEAIKEARKIAYDARRIARTEPAHAYHEADRTISERSPVVKGMQWALSPRHPEPDICDVYAKHDFHGMGPGVYPPEYLPPLPHPHDLCFMLHVLHEPGQWRKPQPAPQQASEIASIDLLRYMPDATPRALARTLGQVNGTIEKLNELRVAA